MNWIDIFASRVSRLHASEIRELLKLLDQPDIISFAGGIPDPDLFPAKAFKTAYSNIFDSNIQNTALQYSVSEGYIPLREWVAEEMNTLNIPCHIDNILITSGSQQALNYLGKTFLSQNDTVLVTWPTYLGALGAFNAYETHFDRLLDRTNRTPESYKAAAKEAGGRIKFAYMCADFANPTGETLSPAVRNGMLDLAEDLDIAIIEDAAYQALRYEGDPVPPILAMDIERHGHIDKTRTLYCGTFSKTLAPGLRVGWVCGAKSVISRLVLMKQASDLHSSTINQIAMTGVAVNGFNQQVMKLRKAYGQRRDNMLTALEKYMPEGVNWTRPKGGMFIWVTLPEHIDGTQLLQKSLKTQKVAFVPGQAFFADGSGANTIRLSFSLADEATIKDGIKRLGSLIRDALLEDA